MNFYITLTDEEVEFIKYVLTLSKNFAKQIFKSKVIFTKAVITPDGKCIYNVEQTSNGPRICIKVTPYDKNGFIAFPEGKEFGYQYSSYNPWTNEGVRVEILSAEEESRRRKMEELKKLVRLATHLREVVIPGEIVYYSINQEETAAVIDENELVVNNENNLTTSTFMLSRIMEHPELYEFYTMVPTEAITEDIKNMLEQ